MATKIKQPAAEISHELAKYVELRSTLQPPRSSRRSKARATIISRSLNYDRLIRFWIFEGYQISSSQLRGLGPSIVISPVASVRNQFTIRTAVRAA